MTNSPRNDNYRRGLDRWDDEGGAPGDTFARAERVSRGARATSLDLIAEGDRKRENRRDRQFEIRGRANQHVLSIPFRQALGSLPDPLATPRPDAANPLLNPFTFPAHVREDAAPAQPNELPPDPDGSRRGTGSDVDHPLGPHDRQSSR